MRSFGVLIGLVTTMLLVVWMDPAQANHQWGKYHWQHTSDPLALTVISSTTNSPTAWSNMLAGAVHDWKTPTNNKAAELNLSTSAGSTSASARSSCDPVSGKIHVCNYDYGNTGWLGIAEIWIYVKGHDHIAQAIAEANDYYFTGAGSSYVYNNTAEMQHVICQELGHTFGLDHQSTDTSVTLDTCMDYWHNRSSSDTQSTQPNKGDYDELLCIYNPTYNGQTLSSTTTWTNTYDGTTGNSTHTCTGTGHYDTSSKPGGGPGPGGGPPHPSDPSVTVRQVGQFWLITFILWR